MKESPREDPPFHSFHGAAGTPEKSGHEVGGQRDLRLLRRRAETRYTLYSAMATAFRSPLSVDQLRAVGHDITKSAQELSGAALRREIKDFQRTLEEDQPDEERNERLYLRLFVGPGALECPPYESVYRSKEGQVYGPSTVEMVRAMKEEGHALSENLHGPPDHIWIQLAFLTLLSRKQVTALDAGDLETAARAQARAGAFMREHMITWIDPFVKKMERAAPGSIYVSLGKFLRALLHLDSGLLLEGLA